MSRWYVDGYLIVDLDAFCAFSGRPGPRSTFEIWAVPRIGGESAVVGQYNRPEEATAVLDRIVKALKEVS